MASPHPLGKRALTGLLGGSLTGFEEITTALSPGVYRRVRSGRPKFWASHGAHGSNLAGARPTAHNLMVERAWHEMRISPRSDLHLRRLLFRLER